MGERLSGWVGNRVSVMFANDETQFGELEDVGEDFIVLSAGPTQFLINIHSVVRVNQIREA